MAMQGPDEDEHGYSPRKRPWGGNPLMWIIMKLAAVLIVAIARALIRAGARGRFFNIVDLVNRPRAGERHRQAGPSPIALPMDFAVLDELGYLPFA